MGNNRELSAVLNKYFYDLNFVRAVASLLVVVVHVTAANYHLHDGYLNWLLLFFNQISRFATPLFAVISGFLLYNQAIRGRYELKRFINSRFTKIMLPFIIWSFIYLFLKEFSFSELKDADSIKLFIYNFATGKSYVHLYFIAVVIQFYILFPFIQKFHSKRQLFFLALLGLFVNYFYLVSPPEIGSGVIYKFLHERAFLLNWIFYFFLGGLFVHYWRPLTDYVKNNKLFVASFGIIPLYFMTYEYVSADMILGSTRPANLLYVPVFFISLISIYYLLDNYEKFRNIVLEIGNMSMGIYLVNPLVIYFIQRDVSWLLERTRWVFIGYIITVLISILIVKLIHKLPFGQYIVIIAAKKKDGKVKKAKI